jgi:putative inorganic carbon (HCO3(-)) transporter
MRKLLEWLVLAYIVCLPIQFETTVGLRLALSDIFLVLAAFVSLFAMRIPRGAYSIWHFALLGVVLLSAANVYLQQGTVSRYVLVNKTLGFVVLCTLYFVLTNMMISWEQIWRCVRAFVGSVALFNLIVSVAFLIFQVHVGYRSLVGPLMGNQFRRLEGMMGDANAYAGLLLVATTISMLVRPWIFGRKLTIPVILSLMLGILLSLSRSAWLAFALVCMAMTVFNRKAVILTFSIAGIGVVVLPFILGSERFGTWKEFAERQKSIDARFEIIQSALRMYEQHPILGTGLGSFLEQHQIIIHNTLLWMLVECGILGLISFLGFIGWFAYRGLGAYRFGNPSQKSLIAGLIIGHCAMIGLSMGIEALYQRHWWFVMAALGAAIAVSRRERLMRSVSVNVDQEFEAPTDPLPTPS